MPKAKPYPDHPDADEREPTHLESQWEDEASTTVEQGEVAEKVRTLGFAKQANHTSHTHTGTGVDEPTVDDQHAPVLSAITPIRQDNSARLIISQGNDAGQEIEISPGKTYTIGRGLDNDVVLTDIAVSRTHFDLRFEDGAWIIVDRGSGNGTVVNGNVEDNPFMLATGDMIEIGNTVFRYDQPNGAPRASQRAFDDDDEMSTVAGKPLRQEVADDPPPPPQRQARAKTMPPPVPLRPTDASAPPPLSYREPPPPLQPASTLPMPQMANRAPMMGPGSPTMLGDSMGMPMPLPPMHNIPLSTNGMPTTIPGQGPQQRQSYPYPQAAEIPPHSVHAQMLLIQTQGGRRGDGSTAHVAPQHYDPMQYMAPRYTAPQLSRRTKLAIAGIGLALLTGIVTAAVVKSSAPTPKAGISAKDSGKAAKKAETKKPETKPIASKPTVEPIVVPAKDAPKGAEAPKQDLDKAKAEQDAATQKAKAEQATTAQKAKADAEAKAQQDAKARAAKADRSAAQKAAREEAARKAEQARLARAERKASQERRRETRRDATPKQRVAATTDSSSARDKADALYRNKKFNDAANVLANAAKSAPDDDARELRNQATAYTLLGKALSLGMAPAQKASVAFAALQSALNHDATAGGHFKGDISDKLGAVAPKAAVSFIGQKDYAKARSAYLAAQRAGSTDSNLALVKQVLDRVASELYTAAAAEASSNPGPAKEKLKQIKQLVDAKSPIATKAQALYNKL